MQSVAYHLNIRVLFNRRADRAGASVIQRRHGIKRMRKAVCTTFHCLNAAFIIRIGMPDCCYTAAVFDKFTRSVKLRCNRDNFNIF